MNENFFTPRQAGFNTLCEALDHASKSKNSLTFFDAKGQIKSTISYTELRNRSIAGAGFLVKKGLKRCDRLVVVADSTEDFLITFYACQYAGIIPCPIPPLSHAQDINAARKILTAWMMNAASRWIACSSTLSAIINISSKEIKAISLSKIASASNSALQGFTPEPDDPAYIQFSSGSSTFPKGLLVTHRALMCNVNEIAINGLDINQKDRGFNWLPLHHDMGLVGFGIVPMCCQRPVDFISPQTFAGNPSLWVELMSQRQSTIVFAPSFAWRLAAARFKETRSIDLSSLRVCGIGGDKIKIDDLAHFNKRFKPYGFKSEAFCPCYGLAEATVAVSISRPGALSEILEKDSETDASFFDGKIPCGTPLPSLQIDIRNQSGKSVEEGSEGDLWIKGENVVKECINGDLCIDEAGFLNTGDIASISKNELKIIGRSKELIIIRGKNIWPQDVEESFQKVSGIAQTRLCCIGIEEEMNERIAILIQGENDINESLILKAVEHITLEFGSKPKVMIVPEKSLPFTTSGKLSRLRTKKRLAAGKITITHDMEEEVTNE